MPLLIKGIIKGVKAMESIDELLAQLKAEYQSQEEPQPKRQTPPSPPPQSSALWVRQLLLDGNRQDRTGLTGGGSGSCFEQAQTEQPMANLLAQVQTEIEEKERAEELQRQQKREEEQVATRKALANYAQEWLKKLDPNTTEGLWFEEFAYSYSSKLEAAIDYLEALGENRS